MEESGADAYLLEARPCLERKNWKFGKQSRNHVRLATRASWTLLPSRNMSAAKKLAKLSSLKQRRGKAAAEPLFPFSDLNAEDRIMDQLSGASTPVVQHNTVAARESLRVAKIVCGTTAPARGSPIVAATDHERRTKDNLLEGKEEKNKKKIQMDVDIKKMWEIYHDNVKDGHIRSTGSIEDADEPSTPVRVQRSDSPASRHQHGECIAHPAGRGCACEKVQLPTMDQKAAWQVMALRYKAVHSPAVCASPSSSANAPHEPRESDPLPNRANVPPAEDHLERKLAEWQVKVLRYKAAHSPAVCASPSSGANAPLDPQESDPLPRRANAPPADDRRERNHQVEMVPSRIPSRSTGPVVLSAPFRLPEIFQTRVAMKLVGHDSRTRAFGQYVGMRVL